MVEASPSLPLPPQPRLRGVLHKWAFYASVVLGVTLVIVAPGGQGRFAAAVYAASVAALFGISALYHRCEWPTEATRRWMRRLDHTTIFVAIAGTYTPFMLLELDGPLATGILIVVWAGALGGALMKLVWIDAPGWLAAILYVALGWVAVLAFPSLFEALGVTPFAMFTAAGVLYTLGAFVWAFHRPDPLPEVFGYHEVFHALTITAVALQYAVVAFFVLPGAA
jgi:hemolysin III